MRLRLGFLIVCLGLLFGSALGGSATASHSSLNAARGFDEYRLYYAGAETGAFQLNVVDRGETRRKGKRSSIWNFGYGTCTPPPDEGGCNLPVQIQNWSTCIRWAGIYPGKPRLFGFRGAKAAWVPTAGSFEVYTGRTTAVIFAHSRQLAESAAWALRSVRQGESPAKLPPPAKGSLRGNLPCQRNPT
ncbi:MAG TPA: hypothetical protein VN732_02800 [Solirubrobacterales bacterium]|nr:hypothetical protein [Solirubrobacterales bacterium]